MTNIIYPYKKIIRMEFLEEADFPKEFIEETFTERQFNFYFQAWLSAKNIILSGEKNMPLERFIEILGNYHKKEIIESEKIVIVQNSPDYREKFSPKGIEIGELEELSSLEYSAFVEGIEKLRKQK